jgi:cyclic lactone autoinducer peptide
VRKVTEIIIKLAEKAAKKAAGDASLWTAHQPIEPSSLKKTPKN